MITENLHRFYIKVSNTDPTTTTVLIYNNKVNEANYTYWRCSPKVYWRCIPKVYNYKLLFWGNKTLKTAQLYKKNQIKKYWIDKLKSDLA